jgi:tripartite-type tricarboxylate transporter receptor subunit TctC
MKTTMIAVAAAALAFAVTAQAQEYPTKPIHLYQGFAPGGNVDTVARILGNEMTKGLGQPFVVEAKVGAGGNIAADAVAKATPDGYTLLLAAGAHPASAALYKSLNFKPVDDFAWIATVATYPFVISVRPDSPIKNLADLLKAAKAKPDAVSYGSAGIGSIQHMTAEYLGAMAGVKLLHVPYRGESVAVTALLSKEVDFIVTTTSVGLAQTEAGSFRPIAVSGATRWKAMPNVPTVEEAGGLKGFEVSSWSGIAAPAGTPKPIVDKLNAELHRVVAVPEVRSKLEGFGFVVAASTPQEMHDRVAREAARWNKVIDDAKIERQ